MLIVKCGYGVGNVRFYVSRQLAAPILIHQNQNQPFKRRSKKSFASGAGECSSVEAFQKFG